MIQDTHPCLSIRATMFLQLNSSLNLKFLLPFNFRIHTIIRLAQQPPSLVIKRCKKKGEECASDFPTTSSSLSKASSTSRSCSELVSGSEKDIREPGDKNSRPLVWLLLCADCTLTSCMLIQTALPACVQINHFLIQFLHLLVTPKQRPTGGMKMRLAYPPPDFSYSFSLWINFT